MFPLLPCFPCVCRNLGANLLLTIEIRSYDQKDDCLEFLIVIIDPRSALFAVSPLFVVNGSVHGHERWIHVLHSLYCFYFVVGGLWYSGFSIQYSVRSSSSRARSARTSTLDDRTLNSHLVLFIFVVKRMQRAMTHGHTSTGHDTLTVRQKLYNRVSTSSPETRKER